MTSNNGSGRNLFFNILLRIPVPWVFVLTYLAGVVVQLLFPVRVHSMHALLIIKIAGAIIFLGGAFFAGWSLVIFRKARTTTTPGESSNKLVQTGPYAFSRNPMYVSLTLAYIGEAGMLVQAWPLVVLPLVILYVNRVVIPLEEQILLRDYKDAYREYCARVRRWI